MFELCSLAQDAPAEKTGDTDRIIEKDEYDLGEYVAHVSDYLSDE